MNFLRKINLEKLLKILLSAFLFLLPWQTIFIFREVFLGGVKFEYATLGMYATEVLFWITAIIFMFWYGAKWREAGKKIKKFALTKDRIFLISCLLFMLYVLSSVVWALDPAVALQSSLHIMEAILIFLMIFLGPLSFLEAAFWLVFGAGVTAILGIGQFLFQATFASKWLGLVKYESWKAGTSIISGAGVGRWLRGYGTFSHPNIFGGYLALSMIVAMLLALVVKRGKTCKIGNWFLCQENYREQIIFYSTTALVVSGLFLSFSRSAILTLSIFLIILLFLSLHKGTDFYRLRFLSIYSIVIILLFSAIFWPLVSVRTTASSANETQSIEERLNGYEESWKIIKENLWLGVGIGNYTIYLQHDHPQVPAWEFQPVHNVFLLLTAELGLVGLTLLFLCIVTFSIWQIRKFKIDIMHINLFYIILIISFLILANLDHYLYSSYVGLALTGVFWGLLTRFNTQYLHK
ncbi:O-antigen ligase family protein [Patescibacteria group bacterium]|nr:O-antigen ligase family protein [Patescibacteria group bacterium]